MILTVLFISFIIAFADLAHELDQSDNLILGSPVTPQRSSSSPTAPHAFCGLQVSP